ncbi:hypothetical protein EGW08_018613 [Elysia chlorotica]|uniref:Fibrinogen C-terminal domain-containing protein n=1 Tax=Elysia chlorotica TaxID=188477 RepID=A0A433SWC8_ELYCH|nr:hypothetical protein EGW08_018613 [Elysia chlorotica]
MFISSSAVRNQFVATMRKTTAAFFVLAFCGTLTEGFDFTFTLSKPDPSAQSDDRKVCAVLRCEEKLGEPSSSDTHANQSRSLSTFSVYKTRLAGDGARAHWRQLASLTSDWPELNRVSDGIRITGQLTDHQAMLEIELVKAQDCLESQFSCVAVSVDNLGRTSVKKSVVGSGVDSQEDLGPGLKGADLLKAALADDGQTGSGAILAQLVGLKLDWIESRLDHAVQALGNRLEDRIRDLQDTVSEKVAGLDGNVQTRFGSLELRLNSLENRIEDKIEQSHPWRSKMLDQTNTTSSGRAGVCDFLASKLNTLADKQDVKEQQLDTCVSEIMKLSGQSASTNRSDQLNTLRISVQQIETNLLSIDHRLENLAIVTNQSDATARRQNNLLIGLVSMVTNLSSVTQNLTSTVDNFRSKYAGGALVQVPEFFDLLGTGKKEWRLAFRGTPYVNAQVYPAYMYGTGIPVEVEEGCKQFNQSLPCASHYRNRDAFDNWTGVDEVLFAVYKAGRMVHRVTFNGKGSSPISWFSEDRILSSTWTDLSTKSHVVFSIFGEKTESVQRRFFMNFDYDRGCAGFRGWFYAGDLHGGCPADQTIATPMFRYATGSTLAVWASPGSAQADAIGVFLKYE